MGRIIENLTIAEELQPYDAEYSAWRDFCRDWEEHEGKEDAGAFEKRQEERRKFLMATNPTYRAIIEANPDLLE